MQSQPSPVQEVLERYFGTIARDPSLPVGMNIAAGIALADLHGEPEACPSDCGCADCLAFDAARAA